MMASVRRKWSKIDDAELLILIASADDHAFEEFVSRYALSVAVLASRVLGTSPPTDLSVAVFAKIRTLANEGPKDAVSVKNWVLDLALAVSLEYQKETHPDSIRMDEDERRDLAGQIADTSDLFRQIEEYLTYQAAKADLPPKGRVGIARGRYIMTPAFDDPLSEFESYV